MSWRINASSSSKLCEKKTDKKNAESKMVSGKKGFRYLAVLAADFDVVVFVKSIEPPSVYTKAGLV